MSLLKLSSLYLEWNHMLPWVPTLHAIWPCPTLLTVLWLSFAHYTPKLWISLVNVISSLFLFLRRVKSFQLLSFVVVALQKTISSIIVFELCFYFLQWLILFFLSFRTFHESFLLRKVISRLPYLSAYSSPNHILMLFCLVPAIT